MKKKTVHTHFFGDVLKNNNITWIADGNRKIEINMQSSANELLINNNYLLI